jgi:outer membrane protein assembly factor BamD
MTIMEIMKRVTISLLVLFLLIGCAGKKDKGLKTVQGDPETLYKQALAEFNAKKYKGAIEKFELLRSNFPDSSPYATWAELRVADSHFYLKEYVEAAAGYEEFKKIHPTYEEGAYVQFQIGMSYFNWMTTSDRDQTYTKKALASFEYLVANYPPSLFTEKGKDKIGLCKRQLAEHEYWIGDFYYRQEKYGAAASRFEGLLETFPKWPDEDKTLLYLGKAYLVLDKEEKGKETLGRLIKEYPGSPSAREARTILSKGLKMKKSSRKAMEAKKAKGKGKTPEPEPESLVLVKYEEEGRRAVSLKEEKVSIPVSREWAPSRQEETKKVEPPPVSAPMEEERTRAVPEALREEKTKAEREEEPKKDEALPAAAPMEEERTKAVPEVLREEKAEVERKEESKKVESLPVSAPMEEERAKATPEAKKAEPLPPSTPMEEKRVKSTPPPPSEDLKIVLIPGEEPRKGFTPPKAESKIEKVAKRPEGEKQKALLPGMFPPSMEKERQKREAFPAGQENKITVDTAQPIDIMSDSVETYTKENLILFKGNVTARQKDMVIYADSLEAVIIEDGKGIEKVVAGGNVKIQQGLRVANCQKAIFYNLDKRVVLTGEPKLSEGDNTVSGDEIIFDMDQNRVEVKGGPGGGRGKVRIYQKVEPEKRE